MSNSRKADGKQAFIVPVNGEVVVGNHSKFFSRSNGFDIQSGDTIAGPFHTDRVRPISPWTSATQFIYNLAIAAAAVNSFKRESKFRGGNVVINDIFELAACECLEKRVCKFLKFPNSK